ncbi:hypothetical protein BBP40_000553 [Aspergillus hancockii]|nr:hypothetical protein BBP40_000553 [Aspergillus hancockii]
MGMPAGASQSSMPTGGHSGSSSGGSSSSISAPYSSNTDDKTLRELYLWLFYDSVKQGLGAVICAMTKVNGTLSCQNSDLLMGHLKTELGFPGFVYRDANAQLSAVNGEDYGSFSVWSTSTMQQLLSNGTLTKAPLNDMAIRNLIGYYYVGLDDGRQSEKKAMNAYIDVHGSAELKNKNNSLPLNKPRVMSVFGAHHRSHIAGPNPPSASNVPAL